MPEVTLEASVAVDVASKEDIDKHHAWLKDRLGEKFGVEDRVIGNATPAGSYASPTLVRIPNSTVPSGKLYVANWMAFFVDGFITVPTGIVATLCVGRPSIPFSTAALPSFDVVAPFQAMGYTSLRKVMARANQEFYVILSGTGTLTNATNLMVNIGVDIWPDTAEARRHI